MDAEGQVAHLKAYGVTYAALKLEIGADWLLNYRGGSFGIDDIDAIERLCELRHDLLMMRRAVLPLQEVCNGLMRYDVALIPSDMRPYFRDVQDHVIRVVEGVDNLRELLKSSLEANMLLASMKQNDVTKQLAAWAAILAVPTAIAGVYGMNFKYMPELDYPAAYPLVILSILLLCGFLYYRFKRSGWL